jgi:hypothetical protein
VTNLDTITDDIPRMSVEQLNELIYRLSAEGRLRYDTQRELDLMRRKKLAQEYRDGSDNDPEVLRHVFDKPIRLNGTVLAGVDNIDAKASLSLSKPDLDRG